MTRSFYNQKKEKCWCWKSNLVCLYLPLRLLIWFVVKHLLRKKGRRVNKRSYFGWYNSRGSNMLGVFYSSVSSYMKGSTSFIRLHFHASIGTNSLIEYPFSPPQTTFKSPLSADAAVVKATTAKRLKSC